ncbi:hypothetical protein MJO29_002797 [Puccinia striiformis f. sp. tritici]|nr:hypothetical protein MJO29_002797 [Puccinia striiformis f. sp. tritici]
MKSNESTHSISSDEDDGRKISVTIEPSNSKPNQSVKQYFQPFSHEKTLKLHELLVKSLISSNLPFSFFENPYFQEYQLELARSVYKIPRRVQVIEKILPVVHAQHELLMLNKIKEQKQLTLSLDGWTDNSGNSIYTLMALKGAKQKYFIDILDLNHKRHTAENIFSALKGSLASKQIGLDQVCAVVTDSPSVMLKLCRLLNDQNPHILKVHCTLHVFNLIAKRVVNHPTMEAVVKKNKTLVNYFTNSGFWRKHLTTWQKENDVKHGLQTLCETRWYSMAKVCLGVQSHEIGFKKCLELLRNKQVDTPSMTDAVVKVIEDRDHFTANQTLVQLLKPVVDAIGHLERADTTLADIWKEMIQTYKSIRDADVYSRFEPFKQHCLDVLHAQTKTFHEDIYVLSFFLHPAYQRVAVSKKHSLNDIGHMILHVAKHWKMSKSEASLLRDAVHHYYNATYLYHSKKIDKPLHYWLTVPYTPESEPLKKLAIGILEIVPHAAGVEGLFSMMTAMKTKARNRLLPNTLKMMAQIKLHLLQGDPLLSARRKKTRTSPKSTQDNSEYENMKAYDSFLTPAELEVFEEGIFTESQISTLTSRENAPGKPDDVIDIDVIEDIEAEESNWDPEDLWVS